MPTPTANSLQYPTEIAAVGGDATDFYATWLKDGIRTF